MPFRRRPDDPRERTPGSGAGHQPPDQRRRWADLAEERITTAQEQGEFENLSGAGQRLQIDQNVYAGEKALAYSLLKRNNLAPPEIERGKEIDADQERAEELLATLRRRRDALKMRRNADFASERRAYNLLRDKTETRYGEALRAINSKILSLNIVAPAPLHRRTIDIERRLRAFRDEFPRLAD